MNDTRTAYKEVDGQPCDMYKISAGTQSAKAIALHVIP